MVTSSGQVAVIKTMAGAAPLLAVRGSTGISLHHGPPNYELVAPFERDERKNCKCMLFSPHGDYFAWANGEKVTIVRTNDWKVVAALDKPRVSALDFSPLGTYLATWEMYTTSGDSPILNLSIFKSATGELLTSYEQKKQSNWEPLWTADEAFCSRNFKNDILFYSKENLNEVTSKLANQSVHTYSISPAPYPPYHILCYKPGKQQKPNLAQIYKYDKYENAVATKSFFQADRIEMFWNKKGTGVLLLTTEDVDKTGSSYYGKQMLHFLSTNGDTSMVTLSKEGPIHSVAWSPMSKEFTVVYGFMPAKATIFNYKCDPVFELGDGPRNSIYYNPHGNILLLGGFGNLPGYVELWEAPARKFITKMNAPDTTLLEWSPEGTHFLTATTAPRLRICNGFKVWHYMGTLLYERPWNKQEELWEVTWQKVKDGRFAMPVLNYVAVEGIASTAPQASKEVYRPPVARGRPATFKLNDDSAPPPLPPSKNASRSKKKREAKKTAKSTASDDNSESSWNNSTAKSTPPTDISADETDKKKKLRIKSKLNEIEKLKGQQKAGKQLELNQLEKIKREPALLEELRALAI